MSTIKATNFQHPSAASPAIVLDAAGNATVAGMGLVLVKPTGIANTGGSASLSGGAVTFTGVSSVSLDGVFSAAYENYLVIVAALGSTDNNALIRFRTAGTDNTGSSYAHQRLIVDGATASGSRSTGQTTSVWGNIAISGIGINSILIGSPFDSGKPTFGRSTTNSPYLGAFIQDAAFTFASNVSFDGFTIYNSAGTITGKIRVYGYNNG